MFFLLTPYLITFFFGNLQEGSGQQALSLEMDMGEEASVLISNETAFGSEMIPIEAYVADRLARSMDENYEMEALKAQAVLIRSNLLTEITEENRYDTVGGACDVQEYKKEIRVKDPDYGKVPAKENALEAATQTRGVYIAYEGRPAKGAYFAVSNGKTRDGEEMMPGESPYLKSASCERDFLSEDFNSRAVYRESEFEEIWRSMQSLPILEDEILEKGEITSEKAMEKYTLYRDSADYVLYIEREGRYVSGEQFRRAFGLSSASFQLRGEEGQVIITVKGSGHGFGMSQFGANEMAKEGKDYIHILNYFFQDVTITKFE